MAKVLPDTLLTAQQAALSRDERLDTLNLNPIKRGIPSLPIANSVVGARATLTIEGASTIELDMLDPDWLLEASGLIDVQDDGRMLAVNITVDALVFRLCQATRKTWDTITLVFEDEVVALMRTHSKPLAASRGSVTRAQFIERMVREVKDRKIPFFAPEKGRKQPVELPDYPNTRPTAPDSGFDDGTRVKIKGDTADSQQMRELAAALGVADQEGAKGRARLAMLVAGIGESAFKAVMNAGGSPYGGVFQGNVRAGVFKLKDTEGMARSFLRGGKGFQAGGAIAAAREHPDWSPGTIAFNVEGDRKNFASDAAAEDFYQQHIDEARAIASAWQSGDGAAGSDVIRLKEFQFTRGLPGKRENSWTAGLRLSDDVTWRLFAMGGVIWFVSDDYLISKPASLVITSPFDPQLLGPPEGYDFDHGKTAAQVDLTAAANRWAVRPGEVVALLGAFGAIKGRWIVETVVLDLLDATAAQITLIKPVPPGKEPAADTVSTDVGPDATGSGAKRAISWARSKIGHYAEEFGNNRGAELDALEKTFNMQGAPWCAIFATTAITHGGVPDDAKTAAVATIRAWAEAGTHGYLKGFRATPKPGDLACFGSSHVALVEKVRGDRVDLIQGNGAAGKVDTRTILKDQAQYVRPDFAT